MRSTASRTATQRALRVKPGTAGTYPEADGQNHLQAVVIHQTTNLPIALGLNYSEFPNSCLRRQLVVVMDIANRELRAVP